MYINKCTKCGAEFETKNPKRVICPNCLYPEKKSASDNDPPATSGESGTSKVTPIAAYSTPGDTQERRPYRNPDYNRQDRPRQGGYNKPYNNQGGNRPYNNQGGNRPYNQHNQGGNRPYNNQGGNRPYNNTGERRPFQQDGGRPQRPGFGRPQRPQRPKQLLVSKEQIAQIEILYKKTLPLPNPDIHEVIGAAIDLEPRKVFFGINLVRQKLMLPKLPFPKRKLAVSQDQLFAIKSLYEPLLPVPPIGCHKIIAAQLKMDEWRVHVGIGLVRKQMGLERWNPDRPDAPKEFKK